jgi:DNA-binding NtrC family response regulator
MGGDINVNSIVDKGTRFEIRFPLKNRKLLMAKEAPLPSTTDADLKTHSDEYTFDETIQLLLVDDEEHFGKVLSKRLEKRNIAVTTVVSGTEAIRALRKEDFDVAVLDLKMEDMDGLEVLKIFKKMYEKMQVIILSGHDSAEIARDGIKYGAFAYLAKPCNFEELINTVKRALDD